MRILDDFSIAAGRLTRIPLFPRDEISSEHLSDAWRTAPAVGAMVGLLAGGGYWVANMLGLSNFFCAVFAVSIFTAAFGGKPETHMAKGAEQYWLPENELQDGPSYFGISIIFITMLMMVALVDSIAEPTRVMAALVCAGAVGQAAWVVAFTRWPHSEGETAALDQPTDEKATFAMLLAVGIAVITGWFMGLVAAGLAGLVAFITLNIVKKHANIGRDGGCSIVGKKAEFMVLIVYAISTASASGLVVF